MATQHLAWRVTARLCIVVTRHTQYPQREVNRMDEELKQHLSAKATWKRGLFILIFALIYSIAEIVVAAIVLFQFVATLFTGTPNDRLLAFSETLTRYIYQILQFVTYTSDYLPYPFGTWPEPTGADAQPPATAAADEPAADTEPPSRNESDAPR